MRPPIFIVERNGDVTVYPSAQQAERAVESVDVEDGEYSAVYDADGRLFELHVETPTKRRRSWLFPWFETIELTPVRLRPKEGLPSHQAELRAALVEHLRRKGVVVGADIALDAVIALCSSARRSGCLRRLALPGTLRCFSVGLRPAFSPPCARAGRPNLTVSSP